MPTIYRPTFADVGLRWPSDSQEMMWNHQTGARLNQADAWRLVQYIRFVVEPACLVAAAEVDATGHLLADMQNAALVTTSKFTIDYVMRPVSSGQAYAVHGNYQWDLTHNLFLKPLRDALVHPRRPFDPVAWLGRDWAFLDLLNVEISGSRVVARPSVVGMAAHAGTFDTTAARAGAVDPRPDQPDRPLSSTLCALVDAAARAHRAHAEALSHYLPRVSWERNEAELAKLAAQVVETQHALEAAAETPRQQMLLGLVFTGGVHPRHTTDYAIACTNATMRHHDEWHDALGCDLGRPPDAVRVIAAALAHARAHYLRAAPPGSRLRELCPECLKPQRGTRCPITSVP